MQYDPDRHQRRSIRLPHYDYAQPGAYFVTVCVQGRECLLGDIEGDEMVPSEAGRMVRSWWHELPRKFPFCDTDAFVIMPNHIHGIIVIRDTPSPVGADLHVRPYSGVRPGSPAPLPRIVQWFKTMTTNAYIQGADRHGWAPFAAHLWQRNYYEHIVRNEGEMNRIRCYVEDNPRNWKGDPDNPAVAQDKQDGRPA
ncbi:MAG: transposase [Dehalococcoidia bacterium]